VPTPTQPDDPSASPSAGASPSPTGWDGSTNSAGPGRRFHWARR
jgi:hypothetical protein